MHLNDVLPIAHELQALLAPACEEVQIAGSVRRKKPDVHDLEFVLLPVRDVDMFGDPTETYSALDAILARLKAKHTLVPDVEIKRDGARQKRLLRPMGLTSNLIVELYIADEKNFGAIFTIRTGCREFGRAMMTARAAGGAMPFHLRQGEGYLWHGGEVVPCRDEKSYFDALGVTWCEPEERTTENVAQLMQRRVR